MKFHNTANKTKMDGSYVIHNSATNNTAMFEIAQLRPGEPLPERAKDMIPIDMDRVDVDKALKLAHDPIVKNMLLSYPSVALSGLEGCPDEAFKATIAGAFLIAVAENKTGRQLSARDVTK